MQATVAGSDTSQPTRVERGPCRSKRVSGETTSSCTSD